MPPKILKMPIWNSPVNLVNNDRAGSLERVRFFMVNCHLYLHMLLVAQKYSM